jgi:conjugal transfer pilus assembly protein TraL|nr:type IV conjugative transfer system protein TraL [Stenotrophomonas pavanii]
MSEVMPFPRYLNTPQRLLFWTLDQMIPFGFFMVTGIITDRPLICITLGLVASRWLTKYRDSRPDNYMYHALYWWGVIGFKGRNAINPFIKRIYPA